MQELKQLIKLIEEQGKGAGAALLNLADTANLETQVYTIVKDNANITERELIERLYGSSKSSAFKMLKSRVKRKLFNQLNLLDFSNSKKYPALLALEIKCNSLLNEALILNDLDAVKLKEKVVLQTIEIAKEAELTDLIVRALEMQRLIYSFKLFNKNKYYELTEEIQEYKRLLRQEEEANDLYLAIMVEVRIGVKNRLQHSQFIVENVKKIKQLWENTGSSVIYGKYYVVKTFLLEAFGDLREHITFLTESENLYLQGRINPLHFPYHRHLYSLTYSYLKNKQFSEGYATAEKLKIQLSPEDNNWFAHMENYFMLATHARDYLRAKEILVEVFSNSKLISNPQFAQERWYLFKEFYNLISGQPLPFKSNIKLKFITQDKHGYNIWYLILNFLKVFNTGDVDSVERMTEGLRKYSLKHYNSEADPRTLSFIKLLIIAGQEHDNKKACKRKSRYLFQKLEQTPFAGDAFAEVEIIPYEHLWELILDEMSK